MKKLICIAVAVALLTSFAACGGNNESDTTTLPSEAESTAITEFSTEKPEPFTEESATEEITAESEQTASETETETEKSSKPESTAEVVEYFNEAINKVKPKAKSIMQNYELNSQVSQMNLGGASSLEKLANKLVEANMGYKDEANKRLLTSTADKNAFFPVEGQSWSSKLTAADVKSAKCTEKDGVYTITINVKNDASSETTARGSGHVGKALSVVSPATILDNAGAAKGIIKNVKTGNANSKIVATVDSKTGNVTHINYYMPWELCLTALGVDVSVVFAIEQDYDINW